MSETKLDMFIETPEVQKRFLFHGLMSLQIQMMNYAAKAGRSECGLCDTLKRDLLKQQFFVKYVSTLSPEYTYLVMGGKILWFK